MPGDVKDKSSPAPEVAPAPQSPKPVKDAPVTVAVVEIKVQGTTTKASDVEDVGEFGPVALLVHLTPDTIF